MVHHSSNDKEFKAKHRLKKYGNVIACYGENLSFGCNDPKEVMLHLIVDDGSHSRGHRNNIFSSEFNFMGCNSGAHTLTQMMSCLNYAAGYVAKGEKDPIEDQI